LVPTPACAGESVRRQARATAREQPIPLRAILRHAMSENLDLVRAIYTDWERGDYSSTDWADSEIELVIADGPSPSAWTGLAGLAEGWRHSLSAWENYRLVAEEFREIDAERVLVLLHRKGRGKTSGLELPETMTKGASVIHVIGGKVTKLVAYWDRDRALADLGLEG
jgi:ketosteroid isomerase-like protein